MVSGPGQQPQHSSPSTDWRGPVQCSQCCTVNTEHQRSRAQVLLPVKEEERQRVLFSTQALSAAASVASAPAAAAGSRAQLEVKSDHAYSSAPPSPIRPQDPLSPSESKYEMPSSVHNRMCTVYCNSALLVVSKVISAC